MVNNKQNLFSRTVMVVLVLLVVVGGSSIWRSLQFGAQLAEAKTKPNSVTTGNVNVSETGEPTIQPVKTPEVEEEIAPLAFDQQMSRLKDIDPELHEVALQVMKSGDVTLWAGTEHARLYAATYSPGQFEFARNDDRKLIRAKLVPYNTIGCDCCFGDVPSQISDWHLKTLSKHQSLEKLDLSMGKITDDGLISLEGLKNLKQLKLADNQIRGPGLIDLERLENLEELDLSYNALEPGALELLAANTKLKKLTLHKCGLNDDSIIGLSRLTSLEEVDLAMNRDLTDAGLQEISKLPMVKILNLKETGVTGEQHLAALTNCPLLEKLTFDPLPYAAVSSLSQLKQLKFIHCQFQGEAAGQGVIEFDFSQMPRLEAINLELGPAQAKVKLQQNPRLRTASILALSKNDVQDFQLTLEDLPELTSLATRNHGAVTIHKVAQLKNVTLHGHVTSSLLAMLNQIERLEELSVAPDRGSDSGAFQGFTHAPHLKKIDIQRQSDYAINDRSMKALVPFSTLEELHFSGSGLTAAGLDDLGTMTQLQNLSISHVDAPNYQWRLTSKFEKLTHLSVIAGRLKSLELSGLPRLEWVDYGKLNVDELIVRDLPALKRFPTRGSQSYWGGEVSSQVVIFDSLPSLERIYLKMPKSAEVRKFQFQDLPKLTAFELRGMRRSQQVFDGDGLAELAALPHLILFRAPQAPVTDDVLQKLASSKSLEHVDVRETLITEQGILEFKESQHCPRIIDFRAAKVNQDELVRLWGPKESWPFKGQW